MRVTRRQLRRIIREVKRKSVGHMGDVQKLAGKVQHALNYADEFQRAHPNMARAMEDLEMVLRSLEDALSEYGREDLSTYY